MEYWAFIGCLTVSFLLCSIVTDLFFKKRKIAVDLTRMLALREFPCNVSFACAYLCLSRKEVVKYYDFIVKLMFNAYPGYFATERLQSLDEVLRCLFPVVDD